MPWALFFVITNILRCAIRIDNYRRERECLIFIIYVDAKYFDSCRRNVKGKSS